MIGAIAGRELRGLLFTPLGWAVLAINALAQGLIFYRLVQAYQASPVIDGNEAGVTYNVVALLFGSTTYIALLLVPILTMGTFSAERSRGTWALLASAPVGSTRLVIGKFIAVALMLLMMLGCAALMAWSLAGATQLDLGMAGAALLGALLSLCGYAAIGIWISTLVSQPPLAAGATLFALLLFWLFQMLGTSGVEVLDRTVAYLSIFAHLEPGLRGEVRSVDLTYFALLIVLPLVLAALQVRRLRGAA